MRTGETLLIDALLERLNSSQASALLDQLDRSIAQNSGRFRPETTRNGRRRSDGRTHNIPENTTSHTSTKDLLS
ncbi:MAG: hypothetical protein WBO23_13185 [Burkholderiales bacterium]